MSEAVAVLQMAIVERRVAEPDAARGVAAAMLVGLVSLGYGIGRR